MQRRRTSREQLVDYFKKNLKKAYTPDTLKWALISQGYSRSAVEQALQEAQKQIAREVPVFKEKPLIKYQVLDQHDNPVTFTKAWWKKIFGL